MQLEHPTVSLFYSSLVLQGNFLHCEELLQKMADLSLFSASRLSSQPYSKWVRLVAAGATDDIPCARGGHAMCIDTTNEKIYLFGGWDGQKNLDDLWVFDIKSEQWKMLDSNTQPESSRPGPRACHKMAFDSATGDLYLFGKLNDSTPTLETGNDPHPSGTTAPSTSPISPLHPRSLPAAGSSSTTSSTSSSPASSGSELYCYHTRGHQAGKWELVIHATAVSDLLFQDVAIYLNSVTLKDCRRATLSV
jgi:muskelin